MKHALYDHHKEHLRTLGVSDIPDHVDIPDEEYAEHKATWRRTLPDADDDVLHTKVIGHHSSKVHSKLSVPVTEAVQASGVDVIKIIRIANRLAWAVIGLLLLILAATIFAPRAHGQFSKISNIDVRNNDNSAQAFVTSPFTFKAGANCSFSNSGTTLTINCSGGAAGAGGSNSQIQWNSTGSLAGISSLTTDGTIVTALTGADWLFADLTTPSKKFQFDASNISAVTTRTMNVPDANATFAQAISAVSHKFITQMSAQGVFTLAQPACADISDAGVFCNGTAYSSLTGAPALPANTTATASNFFTAYNSTTGAFTKAQPAFSDLSGSISVGQSQTLSGDVSGAVNATAVGKVNGVAYAASPSTDTIPVITAANTATYKAVPDCQDSSGNHLNYTASTHAISCGTTSSGGGGFTAPTGWSIANGNWNGGLNNALDVSATLTALPFNVSRVTASLFTGTLTGTPAAGNDFKTIQYNTNITGTANSGDTWADTYRVCNFNLNNAAGVLTHPLCQVFRQFYTSTAGSTTQLAASVYGTMGLVNSNGAIGTLSVAHFEYDASLSGTGTDSDMNVVGIIIPGAITGSPSVPALEGIEVGDISAAGTPGTAKAGISIGGAVSGVKTPLYVTAGTVANIDYMMEINGAKPVWLPSSTLLLGPSNALNANFTAAATPIQLSCSGGACGLGIYNGTMDFFIGENSGNNFTIQRPDNGTTALLIDNATGINYLPNNRAFVASDFTTSGSGTALEAITGLSFALPLNTAENVSFSCYLVYHQNVAAVAVAFGVKNSVSPTQLNASGTLFTSATAFTGGNLQGLASTTATNIVSATPSVITTNWNAELHGMIENPSGAANTVTFLVSTATQGDTVTVKRGSYCVLGN